MCMLVIYLKWGDVCVEGQVLGYLAREAGVSVCRGSSSSSMSCDGLKTGCQLHYGLRKCTRTHVERAGVAPALLYIWNRFVSTVSLTSEPMSRPD